jgi:hypothetical protein
MSAGNGERILRVGRKGNAKLAIGENAVLDPTKPAMVWSGDVAALYNQWADLDAPFWGPDGKFIDGKLGEYNEAKWNLVRRWAIEGGQVVGQPEEGIALAATVTLTEALEFIKLIEDEFRRLKPFFSRESATESSSQEKPDLLFTT